MFFVNKLVLFLFIYLFLPLANEASKQEQWHEMVGMLETQRLFLIVCVFRLLWMELCIGNHRVCC